MESFEDQNVWADISLNEIKARNTETETETDIYSDQVADTSTDKKQMISKEQTLKQRDFDELSKFVQKNLGVEGRFSDSGILNEDRKQSELYEILDSTKNGRKRMFQLTSTRSPETNVWKNLMKSNLWKEHEAITRRWAEEEKYSTSNMSQDLNNDRPNVAFSWSSANKLGNGSVPTMGAVPLKPRTTNEILYSIAMKKAAELRQEQQTEDSMLSPKLVQQQTTHDNGSKSHIKIDPLQQFVAQALPREKKKKPKQKRKSMFWFLGSNHTRGNKQLTSSNRLSTYEHDEITVANPSEDEDNTISVLTGEDHSPSLLQHEDSEDNTNQHIESSLIDLNDPITAQKDPTPPVNVPLPHSTLMSSFQLLEPSRK